MNRFIVFLMLLLVLMDTHAQVDSLDIHAVINLSLEELLQVKIKTASKHTEDISDIPASAVIITRDQIKKFGWKSITEILMNVPGLYLIDQHKWNGMTGFGVRGFFTEGAFSNFLIMVNQSIVSREGYSNQYIIDRIGISVESIDRIEVVRGPMSVIYGNGAFFGAINIITNCELECKNNPAIVNIAYGGENTKRASLHIGKNLDDMRVDFNLLYHNTQGIEIPYTDFTYNKAKSVGGKQVTFLDSVGLSDGISTKNHLYKDVLNLNISANIKNFSIFINHTNTNKGIIWQAPTVDAENNYAKLNGTDAKIEFDKQLVDGLNFIARLNYCDYHSFSSYSILNDNFAGYSNIKSSIFNLESYILYKPIPKLNIISGIMADCLLEASNTVDVPFFNVANSIWRVKPGNQIKNYDIYGQINYEPVSKFSLVGGTRASKIAKYGYQRIINNGLSNEQTYDGIYESDKILVTYRLAAIFKPNKKHVLKALFGTSVVSPNMRQQTTWLTLNNGIPLVPSSIKTYELNYRSLLINHLVISTSLFQNEIDKLIESSGGTASDGTYTVMTQNSGRKRTLGIETDFVFTPFESLFCNLGFSYQQSKNLKSGYENIAIGYSPNWQGFFKLSYKISEFTFGLSSIYVDNMLAEINPTNNERYGDKVDSYLNTNLNIRYEPGIKIPFYIELYINNILNDKIMFPTDATNQWAEKGLPGSTRNFLISLGYNFMFND